MLVELSTISVAEVPTVRLLMMTLAELFLKRATAAVPVAPAVAESVTPSRVSTPPDSLKLGFCSVMVASTEAKAAVAISSVPAVPESMAAKTAAILVDFNEVI